MKTKKIETIKRVWGICAPYHKHIVGIVGFILTRQMINAVFPMVLGMIVTAVAVRDIKSFTTGVIVWTVLGCAGPLINILRERYELMKLDFELSRHLSRISMEKFFSISMGQHNIGHSAIKRSVIGKGESAISGVVYMGIYDVVPTLLMILLPLGFLLANVPIVGICVLGVITCFSIYTIRYNSLFTPRLRKMDSIGNQVSKKNSEVIDNANTVFVNAQETRVRRECDEENAKIGAHGIPMWLSYLNYFYSGQWFITISQAGCMAISGYLAYKGKISSGMFVTLSMWIGSSLGTLTNISNMQRNLAKNLAPIAKYFGFLDYKPDIVLPEKPIPMGRVCGRIEFRNVEFTYRPRVDGDLLSEEGDEGTKKLNVKSDIPALRNVSFILEQGKRHAFVGKSGAGKSTLVGLILRAFDPQSGHILIDGVDLRMLDFRELRRNIGLVPQEVSLFDDTMRRNITFGMNGSADKVTDEQLDRISKLSRISEFSSKLEDGWETVIGERGLKLSGGQRQRVGIARALIKDPQILIFDEATSSLDTENEARIRESINEASVGKTTIIIAHRLATVRDADVIFVFDEGKIVGQGTHEELLSSNEYYQRLVLNQVIMA